MRVVFCVTVGFVAGTQGGIAGFGGGYEGGEHCGGLWAARWMLVNGRANLKVDGKRRILGFWFADCLGGGGWDILRVGCRVLPSVEVISIARARWSRY